MEERTISGELRARSTPKDVFLHLLMIVSLIGTVVSFITLWFQYINKLFPDKLDYYYESVSSAIRMSTSALLVLFPVFLLVSWLIGRDFKNNPDKLEMKIRKWLLYLTLFIAAITIIVDLITLIYNFYGGELTTRFVLKIIVVLAVAASVFGYYFWDLRRKDMSSKTPRSLAWIGAVVVLGTVIAGFFIIGTPAQQRRVRFDERRISDLSTIQSQILNYWINKNSLPPNLDSLKNDVAGIEIPFDPETGQPYEYFATGGLSFRFCANFQTESFSDGQFPRSAVPAYEFVSKSSNWDHGSGRVCFDRTIDPELYNSIRKVPSSVQ